MYSKITSPVQTNLNENAGRGGISLPAVKAFQPAGKASLPPSGAPVQRQVIIGGKKNDDKVIGTGWDEEDQMIIDAMKESPSDFTFSDVGHLRVEVLMRKKVIACMNKINDSGAFRYNWDDENLRLPDEWAPVGYKSEGSQKDPPEVAFRPSDGTTPAEALDGVFNAEAESEGPAYFLDCSTAILLTQYNALLEVFRTLDPDAGELEFNKQHRGMAVAPEGVTAIEKPKQKGEFEAPPGDSLTTEYTIDAIEKLIPGDSVYFVNFADYEETHEGAEAAWAGEHAVYMGNDKFRGFGTESQSHADMIKQLIYCYNNQGTKPGHKAKRESEAASDTITGKRPGILRKVRRMNRPAL